MTGRPRATWGGARAGAGRPKKSLSVRQVDAMRRKASKWAKVTGYDIDEFLLAVIGADKQLLMVDNVPPRDRLAAVKL